MLLTQENVGLFFELHRSLMFFVNQRLQAIPDRPANPDEFSSLPPPTRIKVREALFKHLDLIQAFVDENPNRISQDELDIVLSWRHPVHGKFYVFRELKNYTVFLSTEKQPIAYGVLALTQPFEELIGPYLPVLVETVLLPFKNQIVYDGLMSAYNISFGSGIRRSLNENFKEAKARHGIVTSLPMSATPMPAKSPQANSKLGRGRATVKGHLRRSPAVEELYPAIASFVRTQGHIEIGAQEGFGFVARALDYGGLVFESGKVKTLAQAMSALEAGLAQQGNESLGNE